MKPLTAEEIIKRRQEIDELTAKWKTAKEHGLTLNARDKARLLSLLLEDEQLGTLGHEIDVPNILGHISGLESRLVGLIGKVAAGVV